MLYAWYTQVYLIQIRKLPTTSTVSILRELKNYDTHQKGHISVDMHGNRTGATIPPYITGSLRCTMLLCCCGVSEVVNLLRSGSLLCCVCLTPGITAAEMPLLSFVRPSVFDIITIVLPWSYSGSLVPSCWGSCSVPLVLTCVCVSCVLCCLCCPLCVCWYRVYISRVLCGGARSPPYGSL